MKTAHKAESRMSHGSVLIRGGRVLGVGWNKSRTQNRWVLHQKRDDCTTHAEMNAIRGGRASGGTVIVVRLRKDGLLGNSKPCSNCWERLEKAGVRKVIYS